MLQYPVLNDFYHLKNHPVLDYRVRGHKVCLEQIYFYLIRSNLSFRDQKKQCDFIFNGNNLIHELHNKLYSQLRDGFFLAKLALRRTQASDEKNEP